MLKKIAATFLFLFVLLSMNACGSINTSKKPTEETGNSFSIEEYRIIVNDNREKIYNACVYLCNLGEYEHNYWKSYNALGPEGDMPDTAIDAAFEWLAENSDGTKETVEAAFRDIRQQHKEIVLTVITGPEAREIYKAYTAMYDAYIDLYNLVTEPSNSIDEFVETYNACVNSIKECNQSLSLFLDGYIANPNTTEQATTADPVISATGSEITVGNFKMKIPDGFKVSSIEDNSISISSEDGNCFIGFFAADVSALTEQQIIDYLPKQHQSFMTDGATRSSEKETEAQFGPLSLTLDLYAETSTDLAATVNMDTSFTDSWYTYTVMFRCYAETGNTSDYSTAFAELCFYADYIGADARFDFVQ